jgi:hypothetical protein
MALVKCPFTGEMCDPSNCLECEHYPEELKYIELTEPFIDDDEKKGDENDEQNFI